LTCYFCKREEIDHAPGCPKGTTLEYWDGYKQGRAGLVCPETTNDTYRLGYKNGVSALEYSKSVEKPKYDA
jgi:hypothetical protein